MCNLHFTFYSLQFAFSFHFENCTFIASERIPFPYSEQRSTHCCVDCCPEKRKKKNKLSPSLVNEMKWNWSMPPTLTHSEFRCRVHLGIFCFVVQVNGIGSLSLPFTSTGSHLTDFKLKHDSWDSWDVFVCIRWTSSNPYRYHLFDVNCRALST